MAALHYLCPQFIKEGRLLWLRSPLYIVKDKGKESYYFSDEEFEKARKSIKGEVTRAKGLGALSASQAAHSMFSEEYQRMDTLEVDDDAIVMLESLMGEDIDPRKDFLFNKIDFSEVKE